MITESKAKKLVLNPAYVEDIKDYIKTAKGYSNGFDRERYISTKKVMFFFRSKTGVERFQVQITQDLKSLRFLEETNSGFYDRYSFDLATLFPDKKTAAKEETTTTSTTTKKVAEKTTSTTTKKVVKRAPRKKSTKTTQSSK